MKHKICGDCDHYTACASWNIGSISSMDAAHCANFKKVATSDERKTIDAVPVKHGRWEPSEKYFGYNKCSVCADCYIDPEWAMNGKWHYCPNCGAKMDLEG